MTIAEVSKTFGLTADTLRYYERIGLIPPVKRSSSGIRDYDEKDCNWVEFIKCMRGVGIPVEMLIEYVAMFRLGKETIAARKALLVEQRQQLADKDSLLNYYRRIITIKNQNPEIARGRIVGTQGFDDKAVGAYYVEYEDSKLLIIHNFSKNDAKELTITDDMIKNATLRADLIPESSSKHTELKDGKISVPPQSTVIIKSAE